MSTLFSVIQGPCLTEKGNQLQEDYNKIVMRVNPGANKIEIRKAVEKHFNVKVKNVRTATVRGRQKRVGKNIGYTSNWKKAVITLAEGKIDFLENI